MNSQFGLLEIELLNNLNPHLTIHISADFPPNLNSKQQVISPIVHPKPKIFHLPFSSLICIPRDNTLKLIYLPEIQ